MIVVDTSVWVAARRHVRVASALDALLDADEAALALPVKLELLAGIPRRERRAFDRAFGALAHVVPDDGTWARLPGWVESAADAGDRFSLTDLLVASLARDIGGLVWSLDGDFRRMEQLQFVSLYEPTPP